MNILNYLPGVLLKSKPLRILESEDLSDKTETLGIVKICSACNLLFDDLKDRPFIEFERLKRERTFYIKSGEDLKTLKSDGVWRIALLNGVITIERVGDHNCLERTHYEGCVLAEVERCNECSKFFLEYGSPEILEGGSFTRLGFPKLRQEVYVSDGHYVYMIENNDLSIKSVKKQHCKHVA